MATPGAERRAPAGKGARRRDQLVEATVALVLDHGPAAVSHRRVADRAGASLSATTYYFGSRDELLAAAGDRLVDRWAHQAEAVARDVEAPGAARPPAGYDATTRARLVVAALLPAPPAVAGHYAQLVTARATPALTGAYREGRGRLNAAVERILRATGGVLAAELAIALVDGAVVTALSEGRDPHEEAVRLLSQAG